MLKNQKGITLVALVITIIVLLILSVNSDGFFSKANEAVNEWNNGVYNEGVVINGLINEALSH